MILKKFFNFWKSEPRDSYKNNSYKRKRVYNKTNKNRTSEIWNIRPFKIKIVMGYRFFLLSFSYLTKIPNNLLILTRFLTHNREYWNAISSVVVCLSVANNFSRETLQTLIFHGRLLF